MLRVLSIAILVVIAARAWDRAPLAVPGTSATHGGIGESLPMWSVTGPESVHLILDSVPSPEQRDWLSALQRAGTRISWSSSRIAPIAATLTSLPDPAGATEVAASAPSNAMLAVSDAVGVIDTLRAKDRGIRVDIPGSLTRIGVSAGTGTAWAVAHDTILLKRILVEGAASWETKFTIAALTERGWKVDALTHVAPGVDVRLGSPTSPDTSRYAAAIAVDSTATLVAGSALSFVRRGGGLITLHDAAGIGPRSMTAMVLERRAEGEVRAFRTGAGRVLRVGYRDLWRDRMSGGDTASDPAAQHRAWIARAVATVAYAPRVPLPPDSLADPAPLADLVDRIGPRAAALEDVSPAPHAVPSSLLFAVLLASLLLELTSRRLRGAK